MSSYDEAREAAFAQVMGSIDMPDDNTAEYDEWLFNVAIDAFLAKLSETHAVVPRVATEEMMQASRNVSPSGEWREVIQRAWAAMLAQEVKP